MRLISYIEIRPLDSELQTLVYENYKKFISATDVIKNVSTMGVYLSLCVDQEQQGGDRQGAGELAVEPEQDQWLVC